MKIKTILYFVVLILTFILAFSLLSSFGSSGSGSLDVRPGNIIDEPDDNNYSATIINFTINLYGVDYLYSCEEDMTFSEWCDSEYNEEGKIVSVNNHDLLALTKWTTYNNYVIICLPLEDFDYYYNIDYVSENTVIVTNTTYDTSLFYITQHSS